jgi:hypothetical protein
MRTRRGGVKPFGPALLAAFVVGAGCSTLIEADQYAVGDKGRSTGGTNGVGGGGGAGMAGSVAMDAGAEGSTTGALVGFMRSPGDLDASTGDAGTKATGSGTKLCTATAPCSDEEFECQLSTFDRLQGLCVWPCASSLDCASTHACIGAPPSFDYACLKRCGDDGGVTCPSNLACVFLTGVGESFCLPPVWLKGIGDPCSSNNECASGNCTPYGFCTRTCNEDDRCANRRDGSEDLDLYNENGTHNWCLILDRNQECVPGCDQTAPLACKDYKTTSCRLQTTFSRDNFQAYVCVP